MEFIIGILLGTIIPTILSFFINRRLEKISSKLDEKKADEQNFNILIIESVQALGESNDAMFEALKSGRANGNLDRAMENFGKINAKLNNYLREKATRID